MATGQFVTADAVSHTLAESWDGRTWTLLATPDDQGGPRAFGVVSCASPSACMTAGGFAFTPAVAVWNGSAWSALTVPTPPREYLPTLRGVSCTSATSCTVIGSGLNGGELFAVRWNGGTSWSPLSMPGSSGPFGFTGISCAGPARCLAVGTGGSFLAGFAGFAESWNGRMWRVLRPRRVEWMPGISCPRISRCMAVGAFVSTSDRLRNLAEAWNGTTWRLAGRPALPGELAHVSCISASFCMAVGGSGSATWNGTRWAPVSANPSRGFGPQLSCATATFCMATEGTTFAGGPEPVIWRGTGWNPAPIASPPGATVTDVNGVSCTRPTYCLAVGFSTADVNGGPPDATLAEVWHGKTWRILPSPNPGPDSTFDRLSCVPRSGCMAAGHYTDAKHVSHNFAAWWNGKTWRVIAMPGAVGITGISCAAATSCMAVGSRLSEYIAGSGPGPDLAVRWNGRNWRLTRTEGRGFSDVSCPAPRRCIAVGQAALLTLIERWNATSWRRLRSVNP
jgi:hypothetical protein